MNEDTKEWFRLCFGLLVILASIVVAAEFSKIEAVARHERYLKCVSKGEKEIICSFTSVFKED